MYFNSLPHAEVDPVSLPERRQQKHFNSLPHAEVDQTRDEAERILADISTHYLTQR